MNTPTTPEADYSQRDVRQRQIVPPEKLAATRAIVIGVGAIGRQVAIQLAAVGIPAIDLIDHDAVEVENLAPQAYWASDVGMPKVQATAAACRLLNPSIRVDTHAERFRRSMVKELMGNPMARSCVFCCVDNIETRKLIWEAVRSRAAFWADARMSAEVIRVLASANPILDNRYATTLFTAEQAYAGACTAKSTVYTASIAAGLMLSQFTRWLRGLPVDTDLSLNLLASEMQVT